MSNAAVLEVKNLHKRFGGVHAVNDVSFQVKKGELLGLIGPNGSGKSTTVNLIAGTYTADSGDILFQGKSILRNSIAQRAQRGITRTFQTPRAFQGITVYNSIFTAALTKGSFEEADKKAMEILEMTGLMPLKDVFSEKLPIENRKWLDLARILAIEPELIMLDEVMAGLNPSEMDESMALIRRINESGITIVFIEHVMRAVSALCQRVIVLSDGKMLCEGTPEYALNDPEVIKTYLGGKRG